jgi:hypothetical protein
MKIKKFTTLNEDLESIDKYVPPKNLYLFTKYQKSDKEDFNHLFDSYQILFDYIVCEIYYQLKDYPRALNDFENQNFDNDVDVILEYYETIMTKYNLDELVYQEIKIEKKVKFEDWMKIRMNAKKFNI